MTDYISREAVINDIGELFTICYETLPNDCGHHFIVENELKTHLDFVKNFPAADVREVKRGKWKVYNNTYLCSVCGRPVSFWQSNFCPNCGADMREES